MQNKPFAFIALALLSTCSLAGCALSPTPLSDLENKANAKDRLERLAEARTPIVGTLTLKEAISRAARFNLDHRVEMYEAALREAEHGVSRAAMLPKLAASAGKSGRDEPLAASSYNLQTNTQNFGFSTSQDPRQRAADMGISWNILDFGLSYVRAKQSADKVLIAQENRRKVLQKLIGEVRTVYWRAWAAEQMRRRLQTLEKRAVLALNATRQQANQDHASPLAAITFRRDILEIRRNLQELQREFTSAKYQLAALVNERPDATFRLAAPGDDHNGPASPKSAEQMIAVAMEKRPELREIAYRRRINAHEAEAALLELLPGLQLLAGGNYDSNSFLLDNQWVNWGVKASWNLVRLFQLPARRELIEAQDATLAQRDLALALAVITQIHVGRARVAVLARERETTKAYAATQRELLSHLRGEHKANKIDEQTLLREELNDAVGQLRMMSTEASFQSAQADLAIAIGEHSVEVVPDLPALSRGQDPWALKTGVRRYSALSQK